MLAENTDGLCYIPQGSIFIEKQTAVHIAFQNTMCGSFFREKLTAVHAYI